MKNSTFPIYCNKVSHSFSAVTLLRFFYFKDYFKEDVLQINIFFSRRVLFRLLNAVSIFGQSPQVCQ